MKRCLRTLFALACIAALSALAAYGVAPESALAQSRGQFDGSTHVVSMKVKKLLAGWSETHGATIVFPDHLMGGDALGEVEFLVPDLGKVDLKELQPRSALHELASLTKLSPTALVETALSQKKYALTGIEDPATIPHEVAPFTEVMTSAPTMSAAEFEASDRQHGWVSVSVSLDYVSANSLRTSLAPLISRGGQVVPLGKDKLVVVDQVPNMRRLLKLTHSIDQAPTVTRFDVSEDVDVSVFADLATKVLDYKVTPVPGKQRVLISLPLHARDQLQKALRTIEAALID